MAAAVTLLGTPDFNTTSGNHTVIATPAVGDLIIVVSANGGPVTVEAQNDNQSGAQKPTFDIVVGSTAALRIWVRKNLITAASSTTFQSVATGSTGGGLVVFKVTGMARSGRYAIRQYSTIVTGASGTPAPAFGRPVDTNNPVIGAVINLTSPAGMTQPSGWTLSPTPDLGYITPTTGLSSATRDSGETNTTITWGSSSASAFTAMAIELDTSAGGENSQFVPVPFIPQGRSF